MLLEHQSTLVGARSYPDAITMLALLTLTPVIPSFAPKAKDQAGLSVLVTGAAGRTGKLLYGYLKADPRIGEVRALVYGSGTGSPAERQKAKAALNCSACDASEGSSSIASGSSRGATPSTRGSVGGTRSILPSR